MRRAMNAGNLKLTFPIAIAATQLAWGMIAAPGGFAGSPSTAAHLASLKWGTDYLMACRPSTTDFVAQARNTVHAAKHLGSGICIVWGEWGRKWKGKEGGNGGSH